MMKLQILLPLLFTFFSLSVLSQKHYNDLPLEAKIRIKEGKSTFFSNAKLGPGANPTIQTTGPEQDCNSAIPVCQNVYTTAVSYSGVGPNDEIPSNSCLGSNEKNSVWYTFNTSSAGNLAFNINPNSSSDDYDFALYDITGTNCSSIANGALTPIRCNFSATSGLTGLSASGSNASEPASGPNQSTVLATTIGRTYVLIISNYSSSQSGYTLDFSPGTASIFDVTPPTIINVTAQCGSSSVIFNASEQIKCNTIAANGSDFTITGTGGPYVVTAAAGQNCGVNTAQINLSISPALSGAGPWTVGVTTGSDGNTLIDPCGNIMVAQTKTFTTSPPAVTISGPTSVCEGVVFALTATSASSYTWTGAGVPAGQQNQQTISVTPGTAGTMNFNVNASFGTCGTSSDAHSVTINEGIAANFTASSYSICAGQNIVFNSTSILPCTVGGSGLSICTCGNFLCNTTPQNSSLVLHTWGFGDPLSGGNNFDTGNNPNHTYNTQGTFYVNLNSTMLLGGNNCGTSSTQTVLVLPATPNLTVSPTATICPSQSITLTATGGTTYTWTPSATLNTPNGGTVIATPSVTTTYTVSSPGCSGNQTATVQVVVGGTPPVIGAISGSTLICPNSTGITYSVNNVAGTNYTWSVPAGASITSAPTNSNAITVNFGASAGTVSVTAVGTCGTSTAAISVSLSPALNLTVTPNNSSICAGSSATLTASGATNYTWSPAATLSSPNGATVTASPTTATTYTIIGATGTCTGSATALVSMSSGLTLTLTSNTPTVCPGSSALLDANGATNYTWSPVGTLSSANGSNVTATPLANTIYTVMGSTGTCTGSATISLGIGACVSSACNLALIRSTLTGAGNIELLGMNNTCSLYFINPQFMTGPQAQTYAQSFGANLISVQSATENADLVQALSNQGYSAEVIWIGYSDAVTEGSYVWYDGAPLSYSNWAAGEPNDAGGNEDCTQIYPDGSWNDLNCSGYNSLSVIEVNICPQVTTVANVAAHCPNTNVTLTASTLLGSPGYTYTWVQSGTETFTNTSTPGNTDIISVTSMGANTFTVFTEDRYSCPQSASITLTVNPTPTISVNSATICSGETTTLTANGADTYSWIPGTGLSATSGSVVTGNPTSSQNYTVVGMDGNGCFGGTITAIAVNPLPTITVSPNVTICPSESTTLTASGATSYTWSPALSLSSANGNIVTASPSVSTIYTVQGTSGNCVGTATVSVNVSGNGFSPNVYIVQKNSLCDTSILNWLNVTSVTPSLAQGNLPSGITFNATHSGGGLSTTPSMFSGATFPATYSVPIAATTIRNDLAGTFNFCFSQPVINPQIAFASIGQAVLPITITTSVPYQVLWTGIAMTYVNPTTLIGAEGFTIIRFPGTHTCVSFDYSNNENYINLAFGVMDTECQGQPICPGDPIELIGNGASSYTWSNGATTTTIAPTPSATTNYSVVGVNSDGCTNTASTTVIVNPSPTVTVNSSTICVGQQTATLTANGATTYTWSPGLSAATGSVVTGTPISTQNYTVTGTDVNGCIANETTTITVNPLPTLTVNSASICIGQQTATLIANGASSYTWTPAVNLNSSFGTTVTGTPAATENYTITGADANGCFSSATSTITVNSLPNITANSSTICVGQQTATLTAAGATTYSWIPGTGLSATNVAVVTGTPGATQNYTVAGMDANGCISGTTTTITVNSLPIITVNSSTICVGQQTATLTAAGATTYTWIPGTGLSATTGSMVTGTPGASQNYTVAGMDANGCINGTITAITVNPLPTVTVNSSTICIGQQTATLIANGASSYTWTPAVNLSSSFGTTVTGTPAATENYTITGADANGCFSSATSTITVNSLPTITATSSTICVGQQTATLTAAGATTYSWIPGTGLSATNVAVVTGTPGATQNYTVAGMDANGCINGTTTTITVNSLPIITANSATICVGQQTATLTATGAATYSWIPGTGLSATTGSMVTGTPTVTQNYTVAGIDANGCINGTITGITVNPLPAMTVSPNMTVCPLSTNTLTVSGAATYTWSPNIYLNNNISSTVICTPSVTTTYTIDGLSAASCLSSTLVTVAVNNTVVVNASASTPTICPLGSTSLTATGATTYTWSPALTLSSANGGTVIATPPTSTTYTVIGSTSTCTNSAQVVVTLTINPVISIVPSPSVICSGGSSALTASGANTYTWSPTTTLSSATGSVVNANPNVTSIYNVSGTSALGCSSFTTVTLTVVSTPTITTTGNPLTICAGSTSTLNAFGASTFTWSPGSVSNVNGSPTTATPAFTTTYTVNGSNGTTPFLCTSSNTIQIVVNPNPTVTPSPSVPICEGQFTTIYATGGDAYSWSPTAGVSNPSDSTTIVSPMITTIYTVTATTNNCSSTATVEVLVNPLPILNAGVDTTVNIDNTITLIGSGTNVEYIGFLSPDGTPLNCNYCTTIIVNPQDNTCYTLEGVSTFGCRNTDVVCVTVTKDWDVFIPNAFTPNGDLNNEVFLPMGYGISEIQLTIFDRWGHQIFKSTDDVIGWDGKNKGQLCEQGIYIYQAEIKAMSGAKLKKTGHVTLIPRVK